VRSQRGFTLLETLIALAIALPLGFALLAILGGGLRAASAAATSGADADALASLGERLETEAHSAAALFTAPNEIDFFTRDAAGTPHFWVYRYDAAAKTLTRYVYDDLGPNGPVNLRPFGPRIPNVVSFGATRVPISQLTILALAGYVPRDINIPLGYPGVSGGNALVVVDVGTATGRIHRELAPRLAPSGFSIVVGTYLPVAAATAPPTRTSSGTLYQYFGMQQWRIGPCVEVQISLTPGCGRNGDDSGLLAEQDGADTLPGGTLVAPPSSQIPLRDVCQPNGATNPNAPPLVAALDASGNAYVDVVDASNGAEEWWRVGPAGDYLAPQFPLKPVATAKVSPLGATLVAGPGFWYLTTYWLSC
jgi:prepilin-type N-terminal cleavage/methylation domain-containing protein